MRCIDKAEVAEVEGAAAAAAAVHRSAGRVFHAWCSDPINSRSPQTKQFGSFHSISFRFILGNHGNGISTVYIVLETF